MNFFAVLLSIRFDIPFLPLLVVISIAWVVPMIASILRIEKIPTVILEIVAGFFIGRYLLASLPPDGYQILEFLSLTGFIFLMFLSGLEIDTDQIRSAFPRIFTLKRFINNPFIIGTAIFFLTLLLSFIAANQASRYININNTWYFALIMVTSSIGVILPVLKTRGDNYSRFGQMIIIAAGIADIFSIILFTFTAFTIEHGFRYEIFFIVLLFAAFYLFYKIGERITRVRSFKKITFKLSHAASQIKVRGTILVILLFVVMAQYIGEEVVLLGAFLAGILLSMFLHKGRSLLLIKLDGMGFGFFIPIFFVMVGAQFDPAALNEFDNSLWLFLAVLVIILFAVKIIPALLWTRLFGFRQALSGGILLSSRLSLIIAASKIGLDLGIITPGINACFIIMAVVTCLFSPILYNFLSKEQSTSEGRIIIIGGSSTAVLLARRLKINEKKCVIIEKSPVRLKEIKSKGLNAIHGDGLNLKTYESLGISNDNYVVALTESEEKNLEICKILKTRLLHEKVITQASNLTFEQKLKSLEVEFLDKRRVIASTIENLILRPTAYHTLIESFENYSLEEISVTDPKIDGEQVKNLAFHKDGSLILLRRGSEMEVPHGETQLQLGDILTIIGTEAAVSNFRHTFTGLN